jgi:FkbM family methyltransferase
MELYNAAPDLIPLPEFVLLSRSEFELNYAKLMQLYDSLADAASRRAFTDVWRYRLSGEIKLLEDYTFRPWDQYFEDFLPLGARETFVDIGAFDGDTTEQFCQHCPNYQKVYLFEPSKRNMSKAKERLRHFSRIEFVQEGASDSVGVLNFNPDAGSASNISASGTSVINVTTIDHRIDGKVTFIKMDIEGWELKALSGATEHIRKYHPILAIAAYHTPSHFWEIFESISAVRGDYAVYLRHYTESWTESILYFVPIRGAEITAS